MVECTGLENRNPGNWIEGSNPSLSAKCQAFLRLPWQKMLMFPHLFPHYFWGEGGFLNLSEQLRVD